MKEEFISSKEVPVLKETKIDNILDYLKKGNVEIAEYENVPEAMKKRRKDVNKPKKPHAKDRFDPAT